MNEKCVQTFVLCCKSLQTYLGLCERGLKQTPENKITLCFFLDVPAEKDKMYNTNLTFSLCNRFQKYSCSSHENLSIMNISGLLHPSGPLK